MTLELVVNSGIQLGADSRRTNPAMSPFVFAYRKGMAVIDARQVLYLLRKIIPVVVQLGLYDSIGYFVGLHSYKKSGAGYSFCGRHIVLKRWYGSTLSQLRKYKVPLPSIVFILNQDSYNWINMKTPVRMNIPSVALVDTDGQPGVSMYFIPGNNSAEGTRLFFFYLFLRFLRLGGLKAVSNLYQLLRLEYVSFFKKRLAAASTAKGAFKYIYRYLDNSFLLEDYREVGALKKSTETPGEAARYWARRKGEGLGRSK